MNLGLTIKILRKQSKQTQNEFAYACGITQTYLSQIENNRKDPNLKILETISRHLGITLPILFLYSMTDNDVSSHKRSDFVTISPAIKDFINELLAI